MLDLIGSDDFASAEFRDTPGVRFLNLRGSNRRDAGVAEKALRILKYYARLIGYAATARPKLFHILWNNKFETFDRTVLMLYYRLLGKKVVFTAHNVNAGRRDARDTRLNRLTLRAQYGSAHHIFTHTEKMRDELVEEFGVRPGKVTIIPFGINNAVPDTTRMPENARRQLGIAGGTKTILFFGRIMPYKGLEYLIAAFRNLNRRGKDYRLIIAGQPDRCEEYWNAIRTDIAGDVRSGNILLNADFIPDDDIEIYFKAADVLVLPYRHIYQSGVLFLGQSFGLPVLAADVGSLKENIVEGRTGFVFRPEDVADLERALNRYFASDLYLNLDQRRGEIRSFATERHSWEAVAERTMKVYAGLLRMPQPTEPADRILRAPPAGLEDSPQEVVLSTACSESPRNAVKQS